MIIPILTQHYPMLQRNLLYTGVTRGKRLVVLVGQKKAVAIAVRNPTSLVEAWRVALERRTRSTIIRPDVRRELPSWCRGHIAREKRAGLRLPMD